MHSDANVRMFPEWLDDLPEVVRMTLQHAGMTDIQVLKTLHACSGPVLLADQTADRDAATYFAMLACNPQGRKWYFVLTKKGKYVRFGRAEAGIPQYVRDTLRLADQSHLSARERLEIAGLLF